MKALKRRICPLCQGEKLLKQVTCVDHYVTGESFALLKCERCGFIFTDDAPDEDHIAPYYATANYISHSDTSAGCMNSLYHAARQLNLRRKFKLLQRHSKTQKGNLLDIGTGTGYFPHFVGQKGWNVTALEKNDGARLFAKEHFDLDVLADNQWNTLVPNSFDVITLWHVMEHLHDLDKTWEQLTLLLKKEGRLIIALPNPAAYDAAYYKGDWAAYDVPRHLWHFTASSLQLLAKRHGFSLEKSYPMPMDAFYISILSEKYRKHSFSFLRGMYVGLCAFFHSLLNKQRSSSIIYVFKKEKNEQ
ncbi:MAG: class I SAM-dependent methyltransferase [Bacteroidaceae bacterium]|nr:class I SAM-dependent methyltransferase [Bacteroidaceae bacterium]